MNFWPLGIIFLVAPVLAGLILGALANALIH